MIITINFKGSPSDENIPQFLSPPVSGLPLALDYNHQFNNISCDGAPPQRLSARRHKVGIVSKPTLHPRKLPEGYYFGLAWYR